MKWISTKLAFVGFDNVIIILSIFVKFNNVVKPYKINRFFCYQLSQWTRGAANHWMVQLQLRAPTLSPTILPATRPSTQKQIQLAHHCETAVTKKSVVFVPLNTLSGKVQNCTEGLQVMYIVTKKNICNILSPHYK